MSIHGGSFSESRPSRSLRPVVRLVNNPLEKRIKREELLPLHQKIWEAVQEKPWGKSLAPPAFSKTQHALRFIVRECKNRKIDPENYLTWALDFPDIHPQSYLGWIASSRVIDSFARKKAQNGYSSFGQEALMLDEQGAITLDPSRCVSRIKVEPTPIHFRNSP